MSAVTRGQMASFIARAMKLPVATKDYFSDDNGKTHEADINKIAEAGLTVGCAPGLYCRNDSVNRAQMAAFLARALDLPAATKDYFNDDNSFSLEPEINAAAAGRPDRWLRRQPLLPSGCGHPRADGGVHPASLQARLSPGRWDDHTGPHRTTLYQSRTGPSSGCPRLTLRPMVWNPSQRLS